MSELGSARELLIRGGVVATMDATRRVLRADVHVRGDRIVGVLTPGALIAGARIIEAAGALVVPGFVQCHVHLCQALFRGMADDLPLMDWLRRRIWPFEAAHDPESLRASAELGLAEMMSAGTTTILDLGTVHHHDSVFEAMERAGIRGFSGKAMMDKGQGVPQGLRETTRQSLSESERLARAWSGKAEGRLGYAFAPRFILSCSEKLLRGAAELAGSLPGTLVHSHASEHKGERDEVRKILGRDDVDALAEWGVAGPNTVLAHGVQLSAAQMKRVARAGTRFVHCPSANLKLASGIADIVAMRAAGVVVGLGADGAPCNNRMDPFTELRQAALLAKVRRRDAAAMSAMDALSLLTIEGAKVLGLEAEIGSIEVGKKADLAVVQLDALHAAPSDYDEELESWVARLVYSATPSDVTDVLVDGRTVVRGRELMTLDRDAVLASARAQARALRARAHWR
jgi:5-methylthioadenosine/S-adenosylhomocysteine deaminase